MNDYPKAKEDGTPYWACCVSEIDAGNCNHLRAQTGRKFACCETNNCKNHISSDLSE